MSDLLYHTVEKTWGGVPIESSVREATAEEIQTAELLKETGRCTHKIVRDTAGWSYDCRVCAVCGEIICYVDKGQIVDRDLHNLKKRSTWRG